jgi:hypothetical protein
MSTPTYQYLLLIRNTNWHQDFSSVDIEKVLTRFGAWVERLSCEGKIKGAYPLAHEGKLVAAGKAVTDGPFAESKEAIAGFILIETESVEEAVEIAKSAPCLDYGEILELRAIVSEAPELQIARRRERPVN